MRPSHRYYMVGSMVETLEHFTGERTMFEYKYISILNVCETRKCKQSVGDNYVLLLKFEDGSINFQYYKVLNMKHRRENQRASFSH